MLSFFKNILYYFRLNLDLNNKFNICIINLQKVFNKFKLQINYY